MVEAMFSLFEGLYRDRNGCIDRSSGQFASLKEVAKRFTSTVGTNPGQDREAVVASHKRGVQLAANPLQNPHDRSSHPPNLATSARIGQSVIGEQNREAFGMYLGEEIRPSPPISEFDDWEAYLLYR